MYFSKYCSVYVSQKKFLWIAALLFGIRLLRRFSTLVHAYVSFQNFTYE
jgi:hypothetical protein